MGFHEKLRELRKQANLKQREMSEKLGIDRSTYAYYETGKSKPSLIVLCKIADVFDVSTDYLLGRDDVPKRKD